MCNVLVILGWAAACALWLMWMSAETQNKRLKNQLPKLLALLKKEVGEVSDELNDVEALLVKIAKPE